MNTRSIVLLSLACLTSCVLGDGLEGPPGIDGTRGPDGGPGQQGDPGVSPFSYVDNDVMTDIYYAQGNVGIGTTAPDHLLSIASTAPANADLALRSGAEEAIIGVAGAAGNLQAGSSPGDLVIRNDGAGDIVFSEAGDFERLTIQKTSGNVGIGISAPRGRLDVGGALLLDRQGSGTDTPLYSHDTYNDALLLEAYYSNDGNRRYGDIVALGDYLPGASNGGSTLRFLTNPPTDGVAVERMRVDRDGRVGIGTTSPVNILHIRGVSTANNRAGLTMENTNSSTGGFWSISVGDQNTAIGDGSLAFETDVSAPMTMTKAGDIGIGTSTPMATLDINGTARLKPYSGAEPVACDSAHAGTIALTGAYLMCVCNGSTWRFVRDDQPCMW